MKENKLIAEFMGYEIHTPNGKAFSFKIPNMPTKFTPIENLKYHKSWDWLMSVVEKILSKANDDELIERFYEIQNVIPNREATYKAVVEFINEYNKTK